MHDCFCEADAALGPRRWRRGLLSRDDGNAASELIENEMPRERFQELAAEPGRELYLSPRRGHVFLGEE